MKEIILALEKLDEKIIEHALGKGLRSFYCNPEAAPKKFRKLMRIYFENGSADVKVIDEVSDVDKENALRIKVKNPEDLDRTLAAAKSGAKTLLIDAEDWKIIPLENLIAELKPFGVKIIVFSELSEVETLLGVLEHGVDGVIVKLDKAADIDLVSDLVNAPRRIELAAAEVIDVKNIGLGERACIDTTSILNLGEGILIGNTSALFALVHNESLGSKFTSPRPFRVNAGAVHSYIFMPDKTTRYLSELKAGDRVLIVSKNKARVAAIGRIKIERRPLKIIKVKVGPIEGSVTLQDAETITLLRSDGSPISVTSINPGDRILVHVAESKARHFGKAVEEFIIER